MNIFNYTHKILREIFAIALWTYVATKMFIHNVDIYIANLHVSGFQWILEHQLVSIAITITLYASAFGVLRTFCSTFFLISYPFIVIPWRIILITFSISKFIVKKINAVQAFSIANTTFVLFKDLRYNLTTTVLYLAMFGTSIKTNNKPLLYVAAIALPIMLVVSYARRVSLVFQPTSLFSACKKFLTGVGAANSLKPDDTTLGISISLLSEKQISQRKNSLGLSVIYNKLCLFLAKNLRSYQDSWVPVISGVISIIWLLILTITTFAFINLSIYKISTKLFLFSEAPSLFTFFYYSFKEFVFNTIPQLIPTSHVSQSFEMAENFSALFLSIIFVFLALTVKNERYSREVDNIIFILEEKGQDMENLIKERYSIQDVNEAITELKRLEYGAIPVIIFLSS